MKKNILKFTLRSTNVNGWPMVRAKFNQDLFRDICIQQELTTFEISVPLEILPNCKVTIERYGKTSDNQSQTDDQIVEIIAATIDGSLVPDFVFSKFSKFEFDSQSHNGSRYFGPNGTWIFEFNTPIITWLLDQKIMHESQYDQSYIYPWSYKLGPDSVNTLGSQLESVTLKVNNIL